MRFYGTIFGENRKRAIISEAPILASLPFFSLHANFQMERRGRDGVSPGVGESYVELAISVEVANRDESVGADRRPRRERAVAMSQQLAAVFAISGFRDAATAEKQI